MKTIPFIAQSHPFNRYTALSLFLWSGLAGAAYLWLSPPAGMTMLWIVGVLAFTVYGIRLSRLEQSLQISRTHDALTLLRNRAEIDRLLELECERAGRYEVPLCIVMAHIDNFHRINEMYGYEAGDEVLVEIASRVSRTIRKTDYAGRYEGDEMLVVAPSTPQKGAHEFAQRLNVIIHATPIQLEDGRQIKVTVSFGVCSFSEIRTTAKAMIRGAHEAVQQARTRGRDRVCVAQ